MHGTRGDRADEDCRDDRQQRRHRSDQRLGDCKADRPGECVHVRRGAGDEIAGTGALDGREWQRQDSPHEVLAQACEHLFGEHEGRAACEPGQDRLREHEDGEQRDHAVDVRRGRAVRDRLDKLAEQPRAGQPRHCGERMETEHGAERTPVPAEERRRVEANLRPVRDRKLFAHAASLAFGSVARDCVTRLRRA